MQKTEFTNENSSQKGETPIEKNVIVVDEQGNEYEATYPKRAKGLVKNGRARFVGENKICLARPPKSILEENQMTDNQNRKTVGSAKAAAQSAKEFTDAFEAEMARLTNNKSADPLTAKDIFTQIIALQKQLTDNPFTSLSHLTGAIGAVVGDDGRTHPEISDQVADVCAVFSAREETLRKLLEFYQRMYNDLRCDNAPKKEKEDPET